ncbi:MAG: hypothetical protein E7621_07005 [Ruminococcaceae bacterium]|nr:hypothetical protein [Oscillospiraceae bacterium]
MKKSLKKIKKTRLFFIIAVVAQIASYIASLTMLYKKQKDAAGIFAGLGLLGTIAAIALWKHDADGIVPEKIKSKINSKKNKEVSENEETVLKELSEEEIEKMLSELKIEEEEFEDFEEDYKDFEGLEGAFDDLKKAVDELSAEDGENEEILNEVE